MLIGRKSERQELKRAFESEYSEFVAITGRRRVGKTFLVRETFDYKFAFQHTGLANQTTRNQLKEFKQSLINYGMKKCRIPLNWFDAFTLLGQLLDMKTEKKKVVFIDELPWMDAPHSNFVSAIEHFWNSYVSSRKDILLIICGSATSWIIKKVFRNHGGLHNRVTHTIHLRPFTLNECEKYAHYRNMRASRYDLLQYYMVMGGIPFYWSLLDPTKSVAQNIDHLFFASTGRLRHEFSNLYHSLFKNTEPYLKIVDILANKKIGLSRKQLIKEAGATNNGKFSGILDDLETCGFIRRYQAYDANKDTSIFQLIDNYTLFYYKFIKDRQHLDDNYWTYNLNSPEVYIWEGLAFERVCYEHIYQIKMALGISGVSTRNYAWQVKADPVYGDGAQIDMVIDRADNVVNLCEMKYSKKEYVIDKIVDRNLRNKMGRFAETTKSHKSIFMTMITPYGLRGNIYSGMIQSTVDLDDLFRE